MTEDTANDTKMDDNYRRLQYSELKEFLPNDIIFYIINRYLEPEPDEKLKTYFQFEVISFITERQAAIAQSIKLFLFDPEIRPEMINQFEYQESTRILKRSSCRTAVAKKLAEFTLGKAQKYKHHRRDTDFDADDPQMRREKPKYVQSINNQLNLLNAKLIKTVISGTISYSHIVENILVTMGCGIRPPRRLIII
jgi:hypothetical protein